MLHLRAFGGLHVDRDGQELSGFTARTRPLALLVLLALRREQGMSRDKVVAYLWPESDTHRARNSLKQLLFSLRRSLGQHLIVASGGMLRLDPSSIEVDIWQFEDALAQGSEDTAVALYRGPFLDGFYASGLAEFQWWVEAERERLALQYRDALRTLARRAEAAGHRAAAVSWYRTLAAAEPLSSANALVLMQALVAAGDPAGALEHARQHAMRIKAELGTAPSEDVVAYAEALRNPPVSRITTPRPLPPSSPPRAAVGRVMTPRPGYSFLGRMWEPHRGTWLSSPKPGPVRRRATDRDSQTTLAGLPPPSALTVPAEKPIWRVFLAGLALVALLLLVALLRLVIYS
jgi:DNA-binding SARP family transcriptional activator